MNDRSCAILARTITSQKSMKLKAYRPWSLFHADDPSREEGIDLYWSDWASIKLDADDHVYDFYKLDGRYAGTISVVDAEHQYYGFNTAYQLGVDCAFSPTAMVGHFKAWVKLHKSPHELARIVYDVGVRLKQPPAVLANKLRATADGPEPHRWFDALLPEFPGMDAAYDAAFLAGVARHDIASYLIIFGETLLLKDTYPDLMQHYQNGVTLGVTPDVIRSSIQQAIDNVAHQKTALPDLPPFSVPV